MKFKRGLSEIVTTLIIILLTLVAIGVVWSVAHNLIEKNRESVYVKNTCMGVELEILKASELEVGKYSVTLKRNSLGADIPFYAKVVFSNSYFDKKSSPSNFEEGLSPLSIITSEITSDLSNANKVEVTPFFRDEFGKEHLCSETKSFEFNNRCAGVGFNFNNFGCTLNGLVCIIKFTRLPGGINKPFNFSAVFFNESQGEYWHNISNASLINIGRGFLPGEQVNTANPFNLPGGTKYPTYPTLPFFPEKVKTIAYYLDEEGNKIYCNEEHYYPETGSIPYSNQNFL